MHKYSNCEEMTKYTNKAIKKVVCEINSFIESKELADIIKRNKLEQVVYPLFIELMMASIVAGMVYTLSSNFKDGLSDSEIKEGQLALIQQHGKTIIDMMGLEETLNELYVNGKFNIEDKESVTSTLQ